MLISIGQSCIIMISLVDSRLINKKIPQRGENENNYQKKSH